MEYGDASGQHADVRSAKWSSEAHDAIDPDLASKIPPEG